MMRVLPRQSGMTLIELMVGITIIGLLVVLASPSYSQWMTNTRIRGAADSIQNGLRVARDQAVQLGKPARFELTSASGLPDWTVCLPLAATPYSCTGGEVVQVFNSGSSTGTRVGTSTALVFGTDVSGTVSFGSGVTFNSLGRPTTAPLVAPVARFDISSAQGSSPRRLVAVVNAGGSVRMCDPALTQSTITPQGCGP